MAKIVVVDAFTGNPGDISWDNFKNLGELVIYDRTTPEQLLERCRDAEIILTNKVKFFKTEIDALPKLRYIGILATGTNIVDLTYTRSKGIAVTNVPDYSSASVAQHVIAFILHFCAKVAEHNEAVKKGAWVKSPDFSFTVAPLRELAGTTLAVIGLGSIGRKTAEIAHALGMKIIAAEQSSMGKFTLPYPVKWLPVNEVFQLADFLTLHCPLTPKTEKIINTETLKQMKKTAYVINTGRGPLIDEDALAEALNSGKIAGAALDVLSTEPPSEKNPLLTARNCIITPHIAWASFEARKRLLQIAGENLAAFLKNEAKNLVN